MRYFFEIAYKGTAYHGWQKQSNATSVQEVMEETLGTLFQRKIEITGSGRTDKGVHCEQQFFHADIAETLKIPRLLHQLNAFLGPDMAIASIRPVKETAHARFDALEREYQYRITTRKNPFLNEYAYYFFQALDISAMNKAAEKLRLYEDFEAFSKVKTAVNTFNCKITRAEFVRHNELLIFYVSANRFLRGMVRTITGTLLDVGAGKTTIEQFEQIILEKNRNKAGRSVPAKGLFLTGVTYPSDIFLDK